MGPEDAFEEELLEKFKAKKVKKVYIPAEQEPNYLQYLDVALNELQQKDAPLEEKANFAQDLLRQESDNISKTLESEEAYRSSETRIHKVVDFMQHEPTALAKMLASAGLSIDDSQHGATVSSLCLAVGGNSHSVNREGMTDMAVAALLHDSALAGLGFSTATKYETLSKDDKPNFRKHPQLAMESVAGKKFITPRVLRIIEDHEEYGNGLGFPGKKNITKLQPDSQIFNLCDAFDHFSIQAQTSALECIDSFLQAHESHFSEQLLEILEKQVKGWANKSLTKIQQFPIPFLMDFDAVFHENRS